MLKVKHREYLIILSICLYIYIYYMMIGYIILFLYFVRTYINLLNLYMNLHNKCGFLINLNIILFLFRLNEY